MATLADDGLPIKSVETRDWEVTYRGPMAIHSAKKVFRPKDYDPTFVFWVRQLKLLNGCEYRLGCVLCIVHVLDCVKVQDIRDSLSQRELTFGNYDNSEGQRYAIVTDPAKLRILKSPIPARGYQKFWDWKVPEGLEFK